MKYIAMLLKPTGKEIGQLFTKPHAKELRRIRSGNQEIKVMFPFLQVIYFVIWGRSLCFLNPFPSVKKTVGSIRW